MTAGATPEAIQSRGRGAGVLILKVAVLSAVIVLSGLAISQYDARASDDNYLAAILEKDRLIRSTPSPKIVLVGGSNLAFGIDSRLMQDSLKLRVVNMGLYAKLGLRYMLAQVKPYVRSGDIVVIVPEYDQFYGNFSEGDETLNTALLYAPADRIPDFIKSYSIVDVVLRPRAENVRRAFLVMLADAVGVKDLYFSPDKHEVYNRHSFNQLGDVVSHLGKKSMAPDSIFVGKLPPASSFDPRPIAELNEIGDEARERKAHAYFLFPSYMDRAYVANASAIEWLRRRLIRELRIPALAKPQDFVYPANWFFDTRFHLNAVGRIPRTLKMIEILKAARVRDGW